MFLKMVKTNRA